MLSLFFSTLYLTCHFKHYGYLRCMPTDSSHIYPKKQ
ncbi:hypothetical protein HD_0070 [[Haemophilus] ducreyi 35000HP]|uniref:Uncharacterized protein n=1 Tax=Haemophilus ducreyi (strain 35000HP / ATCC 700724) TaxID=233412 RepID=Q7VPK0_HAEDU|nr:hypothetical protein HD_0070 [[Haemophilus] ducreyi 35000HP]